MTIYPFILFFVLTVAGIQSVCAEPMDIPYPRASAKADNHADYVHALLRESLVFLPNKYRLLPSQAQMQQGCAKHEMKNGTGEVDLLWAKVGVLITAPGQDWKAGKNMKFNPIRTYS